MTKPSTVSTRKPLEQKNDHVWHGVTSKLTLRVRCRSVSLASHSFCLACACFTSSPPHPQAWTTEGQCYAPHRHSTTMSSLNNHTSRPEPQRDNVVSRCHSMSSLNNHTSRPEPQRDNVMCHVVTQQPHPHSTTAPQGLNHRGTMLCVMLSLNNHTLTQQPHLKAWTTKGQCYVSCCHSTTTPQGLNHRGTMLCVMPSLNNHILTQQPHLKAWTTERQCHVVTVHNRSCFFIIQESQSTHLD